MLALADGKLLSEKSSDTNSVTFEMPDHAKQVALLYENRGLQQHTTPTLEKNWLNGIRGVKSGETVLPVEFAVGERERGIQFSGANIENEIKWLRVAIGNDVAMMTNSLLAWHRFEFELPAQKKGVWVPWHLHLEAEGNGFIYVNGRCLGRYWQAGPQHDFFLPDPWLNFGSVKTNIVAISLRPMDKGRWCPGRVGRSGCRLCGISLNAKFSSVDIRKKIWRGCFLAPPSPNLPV